MPQSLSKERPNRGAGRGCRRASKSRRTRHFLHAVYTGCSAFTRNVARISQLGGVHRSVTGATLYGYRDRRDVSVMDDDTRELLAELLEAIAAILVSIEVDYTPRPTAGDQRYSLRRAASLLNRARETLRAATPEPDTEARRIAVAIMQQYVSAGTPYGPSRSGLAEWLTRGIDVGRRQKGQRRARAGGSR